jgi:thiamine biosynthesis lipoprotein
MFRFARNAMATRFEIVMPPGDEMRMRAAAEEAFDEIQRLERQLSLYLPASEIAAVNARASREPVHVSSETFRLLQQAARLSAETHGAFDITIAPLVRAWGFMNNAGRKPDPVELSNAHACVGMQYVELNEAEHTVQFPKQGMMVDLGAIGKGYAVDRAVELLREAGVTSALIHGGTSTTYAMGRLPNGDSWNVALEYPHILNEPARLLAKVPLCDQSLSMSAIWGRTFEEKGQRFGHVIDPRTGQPVNHAVMAAVVCDSATETDALSTALLTLGPDAIDDIVQLRPDLSAVVVSESSELEKFRVVSRKISVEPCVGL